MTKSYDQQVRERQIGRLRATYELHGMIVTETVAPTLRGASL